MYFWFLNDPVRLSRERAAIAQLEESATWLIGTNWSLNDGLNLEAVIRAHGHDYHVRMTYPDLFPSVPPIVRPLNAESRWSSHQYGGVDGPLCLQWGPDNWLPDITGAQMLESTFSLLNIENPMGVGSPGLIEAAPSRHALTMGQELRLRFGRFYVGNELVTYIQELPEQTIGIFHYSTYLRSHSWLAIVHDVQPTSEPTGRTDDAIPKSLPGEEGGRLIRTGLLFRTHLDPEMISSANEIKDLQNLLLQSGHDVSRLLKEEIRSESEVDQQPTGVLILDCTSTLHFFVILSDNKVLSVAQVHPEIQTTASRSPDSHKSLASKSIGIVGLGSVGSKMALTLARMGIRRFFLVDYDVFLPENIERHVLDWSSVGAHKAQAILELLLRIDSHMEVEMSLLHLTGQESSAAVSGALNKLSKCDLIIDATAEPAVFNLLAATTAMNDQSLVWMEVYAGGMGGMIARSRPSQDPNPQIMRALYNQYCSENPAPELAVSTDYTAQDVDGRVLVASDADVSIIAHHAAALAIDTILQRDPSLYPYSMYLIGLAEWWVFSAPFHTIPIAIEQFRVIGAEADTLSEEHADNVAFLMTLLETKHGTDSSSS